MHDMHDERNKKWIRRAFAFDLDGTVTCEETLPRLARELGIETEMKLLTQQTMEGKIAFDESFRLRYSMLRNIPLQRIQAIMGQVRLDEDIAAFIREHTSSCAIVTGNLDVWVQPMIKKLGCKCYASLSRKDENGMLLLEKILDKSDAIRDMRYSAEKIIAIGESFNDVPMLREADIAIAYGGVHRPVSAAVAASDYLALSGEDLCRLLKAL